MKLPSPKAPQADRTSRTSPRGTSTALRQTGGSLQDLADRSPHVARLDSLAAASGPVQGKLLFGAQKAGVGGNVVDASGFTTSPNFDTNHLFEGGGDVPDPEVRFRAGRRPKGFKRNTVVSEAVLKEQVIDKGDEIEGNIPGDAVTTLDFPAGSAYQGVRNAKGEIVGVVNNPRVGIKAQLTAPDMVEIHHIHEAEIELDLTDDNAFPSL